MYLMFLDRKAAPTAEERLASAHRARGMSDADLAAAVEDLRSGGREASPGLHAAALSESWQRGNGVLEDLPGAAEHADAVRVRTRERRREARRAAASSSGGDVAVSEYTRADGTTVSGYSRSRGGS